VGEHQKVTPPSRTAELSRQCISDSERWFPDTAHSILHYALSLGGEVGEFQNILKKIDRGSLSMRDAAVRYKLAMELTDVYVYTLNLAGVLGIDLEKSYEIVRAANDKRFTKERQEREANNA
jgi:NTP pyrophosphatase (non-canonical NTP hydrolase)